MNPQASPETASQHSVSSPPTVLVINDDGTIADLLGTDNHHASVTYEPSIFNALMRLAESSYSLILFHVDAPQRQITDIAQTLRGSAPHTTLLLFGNAWGEIQSRPALSRYADDFLAQPLRRQDILRFLPQTAHPNAHSPSRQPSSPRLATPHDHDHPSYPPELLHFYHQAAQQIPHGIEALVQYAQKELTRMLSVKQVRIDSEIHSTHSIYNRDTQNQTETSTAPNTSIALPGPNGPNGTMTLFPQQSPAPIAQHLIPSIAPMLGTLLYLARRDAGLRRLATTDELTGAHNRRYLEQFVQQMINRSQQDHTKMTLLLFDIDEFKHYNDTYGHAAGDEILRETHLLMRRCCRTHDVIARMGGDEFVVLFWDSGERRQRFSHAEHPTAHHDCPTEDHADASSRETDGPNTWDHHKMAEFMSNRFRRAVQTFHYPKLGVEARGALTISGGLARFPDDGHTLAELLLTADRALMAAKKQGKNRIALASPEETDLL